MAEPPDFIDQLVASGLSERERMIALWCMERAWTMAHQDSVPYAYGCANIANAIKCKFNLPDYGSPLTTHADCQCPVCVRVRQRNQIV